MEKLFSLIYGHVPYYLETLHHTYKNWYQQSIIFQWFFIILGNKSLSLDTHEAQHKPKKINNLFPSWEKEKLHIKLLIICESSHTLFVIHHLTFLSLTSVSSATWKCRQSEWHSEREEEEWNEWFTRLILLIRCVFPLLLYEFFVQCHRNTSFPPTSLRPSDLFATIVWWQKL